jgi:hypothetical protein
VLASSSEDDEISPVEIPTCAMMFRTLRKNVEKHETASTKSREKNDEKTKYEWEKNNLNRSKVKNICKLRKFELGNTFIKTSKSV